MSSLIACKDALRFDGPVEQIEDVLMKPDDPELIKWRNVMAEKGRADKDQSGFAWPQEIS